MKKVKAHNVGITVVIPAYNEQGAILGTIESIAEILRNYADPYEIIVINDGSTDDTLTLLSKAKLEHFILINHKRNMGYGCSLKRGIREAMYDKIIITDADGTYDNTRIPEISDLLSDYRMVVGARTLNRENIPLVRKPAKWFLTWFTSALMQAKIIDLNSGLRGFYRSDMEHLYPLLPDQFSFTTTITIAYLSEHKSVYYLDTKYFKRDGKSKIRPINDFFGFIFKIVNTIMYFEPFRIFLPLALLSFIGTVISLSYDLFVLRNLTDKTVLAFVFTLNFLMLGFIAQMIVKRTNTN
ncbi:MAG: glycosyltransferase family 2 protein [Candidatus Dojkabacteria bacterium]|nr:MAG: glycosyltransferase family 2 protein [Candidatus Dojkabacteria bacterium]